MELSYSNTIKCIPVIQNQQEFLIGVFAIGTILQFTRFTKRIIRDYDEQNLPIYNNEIQREVDRDRVEKIADFLIEDPEATFPTNIVLHIPTFVIKEQRKLDSLVEIVLDESIFDEVRKERQKEGAGNIYINIIDGQHRIKGIEVALERIDLQIKNISQTLERSRQNVDLLNQLNKLIDRRNDLLNIQLVVSFFIDKRLEYQAMIFATINRTQKRVSESLVYSLFGINTSDSPQKTALQVTLALNAHKKSPFYNRIKLYGGEYNNKQSPPLSQAGMVKSIIDLICENLRESERDRYRSRKELFNRSPGSLKRLPFRNYYAANEDTKISDILFYYFTAVRKTFLDSNSISYWDFDPDNMKPNNILHTTVGYQALLNLLVDLLEIINEKDRYESSSYEEYLRKASHLNVSDQLRYVFTSRSKTIFYLDMHLSIWPKDSVSDPRYIKLKTLLES